MPLKDSLTVLGHAALTHAGLPGAGLPTGWTQDVADPANVDMGAGTLSGTFIGGTVNATLIGGNDAALGVVTAGSIGPSSGSMSIDMGDGSLTNVNDITVGSVTIPDGGNINMSGGDIIGAASVGAVIVAAAPPSGAPASGKLPIAYDTTAVSGGTYLWNGSAWVKIATIL